VALLIAAACTAGLLAAAWDVHGLRLGSPLIVLVAAVIDQIRSDTKGSTITYKYLVRELAEGQTFWQHEYKYTVPQTDGVSSLPTIIRNTYDLILLIGRGLRVTVPYGYYF
jgi:hypothetical protein